MTEAFTMNNYRQELTRYIDRRVSDKSTVEDFVQDTFMRAQQWLNQGNSPDKPLAFLYTVARNVILQSHRHKSPFTGDDMDLRLSETPSTEQQIISEQEFALLCTAIESLPDRCQQVFILRKIYQYSQQEIAEHYGISVNTVKTYLKRGFKTMQEVMKDKTK